MSLDTVASYVACAHRGARNLFMAVSPCKMVHDKHTKPSRPNVLSISQMPCTGKSETKVECNPIVVKHSMSA